MFKFIRNLRSKLIAERHNELLAELRIVDEITEGVVIELELGFVKRVRTHNNKLEAYQAKQIKDRAILLIKKCFDKKPKKRSILNKNNLDAFLGHRVEMALYKIQKERREEKVDVNLSKVKRKLESGKYFKMGKN